MGLIFSLSSANVITTMIEVKYGLSKPTSTTTSTTAPATTTTTTSSPFKVNNHSEMCDNVVRFGCDRGVCWRSCNSQNVTANSSCYTSPTPEVHDYHRCTHSTDCSPCWECVDLCRSMYFHKFWYNLIVIVWYDSIIFLLTSFDRIFYLLMTCRLTHNVFGSFLSLFRCYFRWLFQNSDLVPI